MSEGLLLYCFVCFVFFYLQTTPAVLSKMLLVFSKYYEEEVAVEMSMYLSSEFKKVSTIPQS